MHVEIDVYSGRPNPQFDLSEPFSAELGHMLRDLPLANRTEPQPGLGYRGFVVTAETAAALPVKLRVFDGLIIIDDGQQVKVYLDRDGVESRLKRYARQAGYGALVN